MKQFYQSLQNIAKISGLCALMALAALTSEGMFPGKSQYGQNSQFNQSQSSFQNSLINGGEDYNSEDDEELMREMEQTLQQRKQRFEQKKTEHRERIVKAAINLGFRTCGNRQDKNAVLRIINDIYSMGQDAIEHLWFNQNVSVDDVYFGCYNTFGCGCNNRGSNYYNW